MFSSFTTLTFSLRFPGVDFADLAGIAGALAAVAAEAKAAWAAAAGVGADEVEVVLSAGSLVMQIEIRGLASRSAAEDVAAAVSDESLVAESVRASPALLGHLGVDSENLEPAALAALEVGALVAVESMPVVSVEPVAGAQQVGPTTPGGGGGGGGGSGLANALEYGAAGGGAALVAMLVVLGLLVRRRRDLRKRRRGMEAIQREPIADFGVFVLAGEDDSDAECRGAAPTMTYNPLAQRLSQALVDGGSQEGLSAGGMWAPDPWRAGAAEETTANPLVAAGELGALFPEGGYPDDASDCDSGPIFET